ncbi:MAG: hypothetical protein AMJ72_11915, partial [Acidithiobacillales bacterium SM1_46]
ALLREQQLATVLGKTAPRGIDVRSAEPHLAPACAGERFFPSRGCPYPDDTRVTANHAIESGNIAASSCKLPTQDS